MTKSSMKSPTSRSTSSKKVTFKIQTGFPTAGQTSDKLESAMRSANDILKLETANQQLLKDIKSLLSQYHAQCLTRFQVEKLLEQKKIENNKNLVLAEEKKKMYQTIYKQHFVV